MVISASAARVVGATSPECCLGGLEEDPGDVAVACATGLLLLLMLLVVLPSVTANRSTALLRKPRGRWVSSSMNSQHHHLHCSLGLPASMC